MVEYGLLTALSGVIGQFSYYATTTTGPSISFATNLLVSVEDVLRGILTLLQGYISG